MKNFKEIQESQALCGHSFPFGHRCPLLWHSLDLGHVYEIYLLKWDLTHNLHVLAKPHESVSFHYAYGCRRQRIARQLSDNSNFGRESELSPLRTRVSAPSVQVIKCEDGP